tara:strand:+ start:38168 stop:38650 length:483 start_codon:yes stop_codon:yes gene_type:complete
MLAIMLHKVLRWPLDIPGRHGLEFMAIFVFLRLASTQTWAASIASVGAILATGLFSGGSSSIGIGMLILILQGLSLDLLYNHLTWRGRLLFLLPLIAALVHAMKPIIKFLAQDHLSIYSDSLSSGLMIPVMSHCLFGFFGGLFGLLAWKAYTKSSQHFKP